MNICVVYRICLKAMTTICPNARIIYARGKTTLFLVDVHKANISIPKIITWANIESPKSWKLDKIIPPMLSVRRVEK